MQYNCGNYSTLDNMQTINDALELYNKAKEAYYAGEPILSDADFDLLEVELAKTNPEILLSVGSKERGGKVPLPRAMGSLNQAHNQNELDLWAAKFPGSKIVMEKIDGNSCLLVYKSGKLVDSFSRGDGVNGANNTRHTIHMNCIPKRIGNYTGTIRGELVIAKDKWVTVKDIASKNSGREYANSRNFVAGFMNGSEGYKAIYPYFSFVAFDAYDLDYSYKNAVLDELANMGFTVPCYHVVYDNTYDQYSDLMKTTIAESPFECDGIVVEANASSLRDMTVDLSDLNPKYAVKIKPASVGILTTVTQVEWNISKGGLLKPIIHFEPVQLTGVTITKASGYNAKNVVVSGMGVGAKVIITRQGDVIPRVDKVITPVEVTVPSDCEWDANGVELVNTSESGQLAVKIRRLEYFFAKLEVDHMGPANVTAFVYAGVDDAIGAISASKKFYEATVGANGVKAYDILHKRLSNVTPELLFAAMDDFGRGIGERKLRALLKVIPLEKFLSGDITSEEIIAVDGFEARSAELILDNIGLALANYRAIADKVTFTVEEPVELNSNGKLSGQVLCPTGVRFSPELTATITAEGGMITDSMNSTVTMLVAKDPNSGSSKIEKARAKGIRVMSLAELTQLVAG